MVIPIDKMHKVFSPNNQFENIELSSEIIPTYIKIPLSTMTKSPCIFEVQMTEVDAFVIFISTSTKFPTEDNNESWKLLIQESALSFLKMNG